MIVITHRPSRLGWEFDSQDHLISGSGRSLAGSIESADHAVRHYLSGRSGYAVCPGDARHRVEHLVSEEAADSDRADATPAH